MSKRLAEKHRATMEQTASFEEWSKKYLKIEPSQKWRNAWNEIHNPKPEVSEDDEQEAT